MLKNKSIETIAAPQFINIQPYNPLISKCEIKVLYIGQNRNGSFISEEVATKIANSLPGTPIVGCYKTEKDDFGGHGEVVTMDDDGFHFSCETRPYGFVAPDAKVWFKEFIDTDDFGNEIQRKYLMTNGYLWTGQYPEVQNVLSDGQPQSMELDEDSLDGEWRYDSSKGMDFFIINDATFSKLCILGSDVEPCFEGAAITEEKTRVNFSKDDTSVFVNTLFSMMNELKEALQYNEGGLNMANKKMQGAADGAIAEEDRIDEPNPQSEESSEFTVVEEVVEEQEAEVEENSAEESESAEDASAESTDFTLGEKKDDEEQNDDAPIQEDEEEEEKKPEAKHTCEIDEQFAELQDKYTLLEDNYNAAISELNELREFKLNVENKQKDELIAKYYMLTDQDKAEIVEHKAEFTLDEIESKLALLYVKKNVDFSGALEEDEPAATSASPITTFSLDSAVDMNEIPAIVKALRAV